MRPGQNAVNISTIAPVSLAGAQIELGVRRMKITRADAAIPAVSITKIG
jgi:hypothetical protein